MKTGRLIDDVLGCISNPETNIKCINMLFYGPPGSGKTTSALEFTRLIYPEYNDTSVMKINASDERGVGVVREKILSFIDTTSLTNSHTTDNTHVNKKKQGKLVILDEVDYMVHDAQLALSDIMDTHKDIVFILICNYLQKIQPQILSRVVCIRFSKPSYKFLGKLISERMKTKGVSASKKTIPLLCDLSGFDTRKALFLVDVLSTVKKKINTNHIYKYNQYPTESEVTDLLTRILEKNNTIADTTRTICDMVGVKGVSIENIIKSLYNTFKGGNMDHCHWRYVLSGLASVEQMVTYDYHPDVVAAHIASYLHYKP